MHPKKSVSGLFILLSVCFAGFVWPAGMLRAAETAEEPSANEIDALFDLFDDSDQIFEGAAEDETAPEKWTAVADRPYRIGGQFSVSAAANFAHDPPAPGQTDWRGLSRMRSLLAVELEVQPSDTFELFVSGYGFYDFAYAIHGRDQYTDPVLDTYEHELELTETYALFSPLASIDFRFGRQIVVWGVSDNIRVTDILNPLDLREPGMTDLEYIRLPVTMSRIDYYLQQWRFSGLAVHEIRFDKRPVFGSDYFPFPAPLPPEESPASGGDDTEWALSLGRTFSGWDLAFYLANHFDDRAHLEAVGSAAQPALIRRHSRLNMVGAAANVALGNWLLKSEVAWQDGFEYFNAPQERFSRLDVLLGVEYTGITETTIGLEVANRHINGFTDQLRVTPDLVQPDTFQSAIRVVREFLNDSLTCTLLAMTYGPFGQDGAFQRLQAEYDLRDNLEIGVGVVFYQSGDLPQFSDIGDNDRIFAEVTYHF